MLVSCYTTPMNTNPNAKIVLCYGDSNTWGRLPDRSGRYDASERWTGQLQNILGDDYYIIEEGLGGRTTDIDDSREPEKNGKTYLLPCLKSHNPVDTIIIMLGTNDHKTRFNRSAQTIGDSLRGLVDLVKSNVTSKDGSPTQIVLASPVIIEPNAPRFKEFYGGDYCDSAGDESELLAVIMEKIAAETDCIFVDASEVAKVGEDGLHLDSESNQRLAEKFASVIST